MSKPGLHPLRSWCNGPGVWLDTEVYKSSPDDGSVQPRLGATALRVSLHTCMMLDFSFLFFCTSKVYKLKSNLRTNNVWNQSSLTEFQGSGKQWERTFKSHQVFLSILMLVRTLNLPPFSMKPPSLTKRAKVPCHPSEIQNLGSVVHTCTHLNPSQQPTSREALKGKSLCEIYEATHREEVGWGSLGRICLFICGKGL